MVAKRQAPSVTYEGVDSDQARSIAKTFNYGGMIALKGLATPEQAAESVNYFQEKEGRVGVVNK